jgi:hypothetical protein
MTNVDKNNDDGAVTCYQNYISLFPDSRLVKIYFQWIFTFGK